MQLPSIGNISSIVAAATLLASSARGDEPLLARVRRELPGALAQLEARYGSMHGQAEFRSFQAIPNQPVVELDRKMDFAFIPRSGRVSITSNVPGNEKDGNENSIHQSIFGANGDYSFTLRKLRPGDDLALKSVSDDPNQTKVFMTHHYQCELQCALSLDKLDLPRYLQNQWINLDDAVEEVAIDGSKQIMIKYTFIDPVDPKPAKPRSKTDGWFVVAPDQGWAIRAYALIITVPGGYVMTRLGHLDYERSADGHLDPVKHTQRDYRGRVDRKEPGKAIRGFDLTFKSVRYEPLPAKEFRLPAFGMPEVDPKKQGASLTPAHVLFALAVAGFGLAGGLRFLSGRWSRPAASPSS